MKNEVTEKAIHSPLDQGKISIEDIFDKNKKLISQMTFISSVSLKYDADECVLPFQNKFLYQFLDKTFLIAKKKDKLTIKLIANFIILEVKECISIKNDKKGEKPSKFYLSSLKNANGKIEKDIEISNNSKSDYKQFQSCLNELYNGFAVNMTEAEFKTFISMYISPKVIATVKIYKNAGILADNTFIYENALVVKDKIIRANEDGYIKIKDKNYIKLKNDTLNLPRLSNSQKSGKEIANEFISNILECWDKDIVLPLITLGHMVMAIYFEDFIKGVGAPTLLLFGSTGTGKSTLINTGLAIFGLSKDAMSSGGSTAKSNEFYTSNYNGINVCIDDVKGDTLKSSNFTSLIKGAYKGIARRKMLQYGKSIDKITICSPLAYSTNESLPELQEVINRMNVVEIFSDVFQADKFEYHELGVNNQNKLDELSLILPEILKLDKEEVFNLYKELYSVLDNNVSKTQSRVINNIAYAYTGTMILLNIADITIENLEEKVIEFANKQISRYEQIKTPVEKALDGIVVLSQLGLLKAGENYKIIDVEVNNILETHIRFHKESVLSSINKFYSYDRSKQINSDSFMSYAKNHKRYRGTHSVRYDNDKNKVLNSIEFDISSMAEFVNFSKHGILIKGAQPVSSITCNQ